MTATSWKPNSYPNARRSDHTDVYKSASKGDVVVPDPYRWMEDLDSDETDKWTAAQAAFTRSHIDKYPFRKRLEDTLLANQNYERFSTPVLRDDGRWYWTYNSGLQAQPVYYRSKDSRIPDRSKGAKEGEVFMDFNVLTEDGTASFAVEAWSDDGKYLAYGVSYSGSDTTPIYVRPLSAPLTTREQAKNDTGRLPEVLKDVKFSGLRWTPDSKGFFYQRYPERTKGVEASGIETGGDVDAKMYYHRIGTPQSEDTLVYYDKDTPNAMYHLEFTYDRKYVTMSVVSDTSRRNLFWVAEYDPEFASKGGFKWNKIVNEYDAEYDIVDNDGPLFYIRTNKDAPRYKVVTIDVSKPTKFKEFIPESDGSLGDVSSVNRGRNFAVVYKRNVKDEVYIYSKEGKELERLMPDFVGSMYVVARQKQDFLFVSMTGFTTPGASGRYDFNAPEGQRWSPYHTTKISELNPDEFEAQQVWYPSKDGTKVPMFIVRHKDTPFDGTAPALQYGYGGFSISLDPGFSPTVLTQFTRVANIRGGGEFGEDWHKAGYREKKVNCFDDFIAATEYLVKNKYAAPGKVTIHGGSNGGLLVSACVLRAPEGTYGAALSDVGVHDLLRFHKFTIGKAWTSDYGNPDDPKDFDFIYPISPLHNVPPKKILPPLLLATADHDDRVVPSHSFKLAATLQYLRADNPNPILLRVDKKSGHGAGKSTKKRIEESADKYSFIAQSLGLVWKEAEDAVNGKL
ncbi:prolyl oligopeptidase [Ephemerocybe angulata]|uniref:Prolyl endopeptidase n=1 Tax=Ephemerocybe angulata TaxID=980116 RepID=A0A8H6MAZ4_9AGAR|nr:prolyl oligopeptidase [Tulosesus angulatus]